MSQKKNKERVKNKNQKENIMNNSGNPRDSSTF